MSLMLCCLKPGIGAQPVQEMLPGVVIEGNLGHLQQLLRGIITSMSKQLSVLLGCSLNHMLKIRLGSDNYSRDSLDKAT